MIFCRAFTLLCISAASFGYVESSNILVFMPSQGRSHVVPFYPLFRRLGELGHNITIFSHYPMKPTTPNVTSILIEAKISVFDIGFHNLRKHSRLFNWVYINSELQNFFGQLIRTKQFQDFYNAPDTKFDLMFAEMYQMDGSLAIGHHFGCPVIGLSVQPMLTIYHWLMANPITFSYIPHSYLPYSDAMNFWERCVNAVHGVFTTLYYHYVAVPAYQNHVNFLLGSEDDHSRTPSVRELNHRLSFIFVESHFSCSHNRPNGQQIIDVAGIHIGNQSLTEDIKKFMDGAEFGVVYVSLGSLIDPKSASAMGIKLMNVFKNLRARVIWKWKPMELGLQETSNVLIREWLPQIGILNHPNCRLFISHGGFHSVMETIYSGVPILGLPFFTDQRYNMAFVKKMKIGKEIDPDESETEILTAANELLENRKYRLNVENQSRIFKDRATNPMEDAIFWTEYVLKHQNKEDIMQRAARQLTWYQYYLIDVSLVSVVFPLMIIFTLGYIFKTLLTSDSFLFWY